MLFLNYEDFRADPAGVLERLLSYSRLPRPRELCQQALDETWRERAVFRYNQAVPGRGRRRFTPAQMERLRRLIGYYADLDPLADRLIPPP